MLNRHIRSAAIAFGLSCAFVSGAFAHGDEKHFSAGAPGNAKQKARTVEVSMREGNGTMSFTPEHLDVKRGEQIRFIIRNDGALPHEFMLATVKENDAHAKLMEKFPNMVHDDPNGKSIDPGKWAEMLWKFTRRGVFEFACLIPGHRQAGMHGMIVVK